MSNIRSASSMTRISTSPEGRGPLLLVVEEPARRADEQVRPLAQRRRAGGGSPSRRRPPGSTAPCGGRALSASSRICTTSSRVGATTSARGPRGGLGRGLPEEPGEDRDQEGGGLSRARLGLAGHVPPGEADRQRLGLDRGGEDEPGVRDAPADLVRKIVTGEEGLRQVVSRFSGSRGTTQKEFWIGSEIADASRSRP